MVPLPPLHLSSSSEALGGTQETPWASGDFVVSWAGDAKSGDRTAPAGGSVAGALGSGSLLVPALAAVAIVVAAFAWKRSR